jgi:hypothetical protein
MVPTPQARGRRYPGSPCCHRTPPWESVRRHAKERLGSIREAGPRPGKSRCLNVLTWDHAWSLPDDRSWRTLRRYFRS